MLPADVQKRTEAVKHIIGKWLIDSSDGSASVDILEDGRILFDGQDHGPDYHVNLDAKDDLVRGDGWKIEHGHYEPDATSLVWTKEGEQDVEWKRDLSAAGGGGELTVVPTDGGVSPSGVMLGEAGIQGSSRRCHDSSQLEHHPRGPGTHSSKDIRGTALVSSKNKLLNHLDTFAGSQRGHENRQMTDEVNRGFQGFIKNLCRGVMIDIWLPSDVHATDIMNGDKEVLHAVPVCLYMMPEGEGIWFFIPHMNKFCSWKTSKREVDLHFDAMVECHPLVNLRTNERTIDHTETCLTDEMAARSIVLTMQTGGDMEEMYSVDKTRPGTIIMTARTEILSHVLCTNFNITVEHYRQILGHNELGNIAVDKTNFKDPLVQNTSFLHHLYKVKHHPNHRKPGFTVGLKVEVSYDDTMRVETVFDSGTEREHKGFIKLPAPDIFEQGQFCVGEIVDHDLEHDVYTVKFIKGPYFHEEGVIDLDEDDMPFDEHTTFKYVDPAFIEVEQMENLISHPPWFIITISALQIAMFVYSAMTTPGAVTATEPTAGRPWLWYKMVGNGRSGYDSNSDYPVCDDLRWELWRYFTYQFCHKGAQHLGFNIIMQCAMGMPLEMVEGSFRMVRV